MKYTLLKEQFFVCDGVIRPFAHEDLVVSDIVEENGALVTIKRTVTNTGKTPVSFLPVISVRMQNTVRDWFVPSVSYSGNAFGDGMDPKWLTCDGEPWVFPSDHAGVPGCSVVMGDAGTTSLFLPRDCVKSACSLVIDDREVIQRAFFTHMEYPKAYVEKFRYADAILETETLANGESRSYTALLFLCEDSGTFGYRSFIEYLLTDYARDPMDRAKPEIYDHSMAFLRSLVEKRDGMTLTNMGFLPRDRADGKGKEFAFRRGGRYECGWCGQNISNAWLLLYDHLRAHGMTVAAVDAVAPFDISFVVEGSFDLANEDVQNALGILDTWRDARLESGLVPVLLDHVLMGKTEFVFDTCNLGWLVYQYVNVYVLLKRSGIVREDYLDIARGVLDALLPYPALGKGFPQTVNERGEVICDLGMAGTMLTVAALQTYRATGEEKYFTAGKRSFDFYYEHYLSRNAAAGGALDTYCIDKESAGPIFRAALMLERITGDASYLEKAENIACYLQTWMFYYDLPFPAETDAGKCGFTTLGATAVSAQHNHLDCWASYYAPDMRYLSAKTGKCFWHRASDYIREYTFQGISDGKTVLHGLTRPAGAQNEAIFQSSWTFDGRNKKGQFNDWLVSWVNAFRLMDMVHDEISRRAVKEAGDDK